MAAQQMLASAYPTAQWDALRERGLPGRLLAIGSRQHIALNVRETPHRAGALSDLGASFVLSADVAAIKCARISVAAPSRGQALAEPLLK